MDEKYAHEPQDHRPQIVEPIDWVLGLGGTAAMITVLWLSFA
jgi:hypothetical protein